MASGADGTIKVKLGLDDSEYKSGLSGAHKSAESFADKVKSTFVGATVFKAASKGWDLISGSIGKATARLDAMQKAKQVIGVLAGSSEKAAKVVNNLSDAVTDTAYGLDTAATSTQKLATSGLGLDKSTRMVKDMMDAVSFYGDGTNETLANTVDAIAKMNASGKISADQWQRLTDAGIPVLKIFAEKTGKSMEEVSDAFSKGQISAQEFNDVLMDALENGTESFPAVAGKAKEMAGSFATSFTNMSARIAIGIANIITAFNDFLADNSLPTIQEMIANFGSVIRDGLNWIAEEIPKVLNALKDFFAPTAEAIKAATEKIQEAWNSVRDTIAQKLDSNDSLDFVKSALERIRDILPILVEKVGEFVAAFIENLPNIIDKVQTVANTIQGLMPLIAAVAGAFAAWKGIKAVSDIAKTIGDAGKKIKTFGSLVSKGSGLLDGLAYAASSGTGVFASMAESFTLAGGGLSGLSAALGVIGGPITLVVVAIGALVAAFVYLWNTSDGFREFWINLWDGVKEITGQVIDGIVNFFTVTIPEAFQSFVDAAQNLADQVVQFFTVTIPEGINTLVTNIQTFFGTTIPYWIGYAVGFILGKLIEWGASLVQFVTQDIPQFISGVVEWFTQLPGMVWTWLLETINKTAEWVSQMIQKAVQAGKDFITNVVNFIQQLPGKVWSFLSNTISNAASFVGSFANQAIQAGRQFFNGIVNTVRQIPGQMISIGSDIVNGIRSGISGAWGALTGWLGNMARGLIDGVKSALGIGSPSRLFADRIGKWIPAGITLGVEKAMPKAKAFMGRMSTELIDAANMDSLTSRLALESDSGGFKGSLGNTTVYNVNQTINSAKALSPSEIGQQTRNSVRRLAWQ
ncbi:phage tail protein [Holdemanella biformis]|uniref:phage tail protein n=1 Tax=Holdemanella biformis TaxID=1735 RepID=UPI0022E1098B|nr:tape measure protein [Holdemanella biformis]